MTGFSVSLPVQNEPEDTPSQTLPFNQTQRLYEALEAVGVEVSFLPIQDAYHNLCAEEHLPWTGEKWEEMGWEALAFFQRHLRQ